MALAIANTHPKNERLPIGEYWAVQAPALRVYGTLTQGTTTVVNLLGGQSYSDQSPVTLGTFTLDTLNQQIDSGLLTNLPPYLKATIASGTGNVYIRAAVTQ